MPALFLSCTIIASLEVSHVDRQHPHRVLTSPGAAHLGHALSGQRQASASCSTPPSPSLLLSTGVLLAGAQPPARIPASARVDPGRRSRTAQFQLSATSLGLPAPLASVIFPAVGSCLISYHVGEDPFPCLSSSPCLWHRPQSSCCSAMASCWKAPPPALPARRSISPLPACPTPLRLASSNVLLSSSAMRCPWCRPRLLVTPRSSLPPALWCPGRPLASVSAC